MRLMRRTYSLPSDIAERFERRVRPGKRSSTVRELVERWVDEQERAELRRDIIKGCREMADEYLAMEREFHSLG